MAAILKMIDEHFGSDARGRRPGGELRLISERVTPREIIRRRVEQEVAELNDTRRSSGITRSFIVDLPSHSPEALLNGRLASKQPLILLDADVEADRALAAFQKGAFILLADDHQVEDLDAPITVGSDSEIVFLYLTPLKGG
jgi:hypothetical protein